MRNVTLCFAMQLNSNRTVIDTSCNCKGGKGYCKHAAAICKYVNLENTCSKTNQPMIWNRPPQVQLDKYHKGGRIEELFPSQEKRDDKIFTYTDLENISEQHYIEDSPQIEMIKKEKQCEQEKEVRLLEKNRKDANLKYFLQKLYDYQIHSIFQTYHAYTVHVTDSRQMFEKMRCSPEFMSKYKEISVDTDKWMEIAFNSVGQSNTSTWFKERFSRITCSSKAHRIKTRLKNFHELASDFNKEKYKGHLTTAMKYGLDTEKTARLAFQEYYGYIVHEVGLIVSPKQPYLACSPDGIIYTGEFLELLEIKCPYSCENTPIADIEKKTSFVPYLIFDDFGYLKLKESDKYYTQVQVSMYILGIKTCHFFVFSSQDQIHLKLKRDECFLSSLVPKLEMFYFNNFIQHVKFST